MILREFLPERSAEDIAAGRIRLTFGVSEATRSVDLFVLPIRANRAWVDRLNGSLGGVWDSLDGVADPKELLVWLAQQTEPMLDLLAAYDNATALPDRDWLEEHATDQQVLTAFLGVCAAAHPLAVGLIEAVSSDSELLKAAVMTVARSFSKPTSTPPASTAGRHRKSKKN